MRLPPVVWNRQAQFSVGANKRFGLTALLGFDGSARVTDLVTGVTDGTLFGAEVPKFYAVGKGGYGPVRGLDNRNTSFPYSGAIFSGVGARLAPQTYTRVIVAEIITAGTGFFGALTTASTDGSQNYWSFQDGGDASTSGVWNDNSHFVSLIRPWATFMDGAVHTWVFRCNNSTAIDWWFEGVKQSQLTQGASPISSPALARVLFANERTLSVPMQAAFYLYGVADYCMPDDMCASIGRNPWQLQAPIERRVYFTPAAAVSAVQLVYPVSDVATNGWQSSLGGSLFAAIDEPTTPDDTDYVYSPAMPTSSNIARVRLGTTTYAVTNTGHVIRTRIATQQQTTTFTFSLYVGSTLIVQWSQAIDPDQVEQTISYTLTTDDRAAIANAIIAGQDYTDLELSWVATA